MPVYFPSYNPGFFFRNGHVHTIASYFLRKSKPLNFLRTILETTDQDFLALDNLIGSNNRCAILVHGLEGSSESSYISSLALRLKNEDWDVTALNLRGCSGTDNKLFSSYHSGIVDDIDQVIEKLSQTYKTIALIGFSLGGNLVLKYMGTPAMHHLSKVNISAAVSVPCHLSSSSDKLKTWQNYIYSQRFLVSLKEKLSRKMIAFPGNISTEAFENIKTVRDFDDVYTGPAHGFEDAEDYYTKCSSLFSLKNIKTPTLLINAKNDPFLTDLCMPYQEAESNSNLHFYAPQHGGHVGFLPEKKGNPCQHEIWILKFLKTYC